MVTSKSGHRPRADDAAEGADPDEPTRGVDVGAKKEIYQLINQFKADGLSIILVSSEMPEVLGMSDRIMVMHEGHLGGEFTREQATQKY